MNITSAAQPRLPQPPLAESNRPLAGLPPLPSLCRASAPRPVPGDAACFALWDKYAMLPNIRRHSLLVAHVATVLAQRAADMGFAVRVPEVRAGGLLHDIAKTYSVRHGGSHAQIGAAWTVAETGNYAIAQAPLLSSPLHSTPLHSTSLFSTLVPLFPFHFPPLHFISVFSSPLHMMVFHFTPSHFPPLHSFSFPF